MTLKASEGDGGGSMRTALSDLYLEHLLQKRSRPEVREAARPKAGNGRDLAPGRPPPCGAAPAARLPVGGGRRGPRGKGRFEARGLGGPGALSGGNAEAWPGKSAGEGQGKFWVPRGSGDGRTGSMQPQRLGSLDGLLGSARDPRGATAVMPGHSGSCLSGGPLGPRHCHHGRPMLGVHMTGVIPGPWAELLRGEVGLLAAPPPARS